MGRVVQVAKVGYKGFAMVRRFISFVKTRNGKIVVAAAVVGLAMWYQSRSGPTATPHEEETLGGYSDTN